MRAASIRRRPPASQSRRCSQSKRQASHRTTCIRPFVPDSRSSCLGGAGAVDHKQVQGVCALDFFRACCRRHAQLGVQRPLYAASVSVCAGQGRCRRCLNTRRRVVRALKPIEIVAYLTNDPTPAAIAPGRSAARGTAGFARRMSSLSSELSSVRVLAEQVWVETKTDRHHAPA